MRVLLIDDHTLFREGVALLLRPLTTPLEILSAGSCQEAFALLADNPAPDLVLIDLALPGMSGLSGIGTLCKDHPGIPVVALSSSDDKSTVMAALDAGAMGFIPKSSSATVLLGALQLILARGIYLPPSVFLAARELPSMPAAPEHQLGLTPRQMQVLQLILQGKPAKLICRDLDLSAGTVKAHTSAVLRALNATTRTQAVIAAGRMGLRFDGALPSAPCRRRLPERASVRRRLTCGNIQGVHCVRAHTMCRGASHRDPRRSLSLPDSLIAQAILLFWLPLAAANDPASQLPDRGLIRLRLRALFKHQTGRCPRRTRPRRNFIQSQHQIGKYLVSPSTRRVDGGRFSASVAISSGQGSMTHQRVMRFIPLFETRDAAEGFARQQAAAWIVERDVPHPLACTE